MTLKDGAVGSGSPYLDRLARSEQLDSWDVDELSAALAVVDELNAERRRPNGEAQVVDLRLMIYRRRLLYELEQRTDDEL
jgi:hypothetical protein